MGPERQKTSEKDHSEKEQKGNGRKKGLSLSLIGGGQKGEEDNREKRVSELGKSWRKTKEHLNPF